MTWLSVCDWVSLDEAFPGDYNFLNSPRTVVRGGGLLQFLRAALNVGLYRLLSLLVLRCKYLKWT